MTGPRSFPGKVKELTLNSRPLQTSPVEGDLRLGMAGKLLHNHPDYRFCDEAD